MALPVNIDGHGAYVKNWLTKLKADKCELFRAAADTQRIADFMLGHQPDYQLDLEAAPTTLDQVLPANSLPNQGRSSPD